jgi:hypothetical protein
MKNVVFTQGSVGDTKLADGKLGDDGANRRVVAKISTESPATATATATASASGAPNSANGNVPPGSSPNGMPPQMQAGVGFGPIGGVFIGGAGGYFYSREKIVDVNKVVIDKDHHDHEHEQNGTPAANPAGPDYNGLRRDTAWSGSGGSEERGLPTPGEHFGNPFGNQPMINRGSFGGFRGGANFHGGGGGRGR